MMKRTQFLLICLCLISLLGRQNVFAEDTKKPLKLLFLGDSYTIGQGLPLEENYPYQLKSRLESSGKIVAKPIILAESGYTTSNLMATIRGANLSSKDSIDYVFLLIGANNQFRGRTLEEYSYQLGELIKTAQKLVSNDIKRVILLNIPDYSYTPFAKSMDRPKIFKEIKEFNQVIEDVAKYNNIKVLNISQFSKQVTKDKSLLAFDGLHYSKKMYGIWADLVMKGF